MYLSSDKSTNYGKNEQKTHIKCKKSDKEQKPPPNYSKGECQTKPNRI